MPYVYAPLPAGDERGPGFYRRFQSVGEDVDVVCAKHGWTRQPPPGELVLDEDGNIMQERAEAPKPKRGAHDGD